MKTFWMATASGLLLCSAAAMAQTSTAPEQAGHATGEPLRAQVRSNLQQAGFTDVKVMPDSFLVTAKDKSGNPISMIINPDSVTEVVDMATNGQTAAQANPPANGGFVSLQPQGEDMISKVVGLTVKGTNNQTLGTITDLAYRGRQIQAYILSTDGRYVAVAPSAVQINFDPNGKIWRATMNTTEAELKAAPQFNYSNQT